MVESMVETRAIGEGRMTPNRRVLVVGASRGLGEAIVEEYVGRGAHVVGTVRGDGPCRLRAFAATVAGRQAASKSDAAGAGHTAGTTGAERGARVGDAASVAAGVVGTCAGVVGIEHVDVTRPDQIAALRERLGARRFDLLFVVAGISLETWGAVGASIPTDDFRLMMETNVLGVMRTVEALQDLVEPDGTIAVMSSGQGSVSGNDGGGVEVYRATKAALNQMVRSHAARHRDGRRSLLLMAPGWVKTDLGGPGAWFEIGDSIPPLVDTVDAQRGVAGLQYLDRFGRTVAW